MRNNKIDEENAVYMCSKNEKVDRINERFFELNKNKAVNIKKSIDFRFKTRNTEEKYTPIKYNIDKFDDKLKAKLSDFVDECKDITIKKRFIGYGYKEYRCS